MRIMITGGCGFIGSNLVRYALSLGHVVLNLDALTYAGNPRSLSDVRRSDSYYFIRGRVQDADVVNQAFSTFRPDSVIHLAAESHVDRSIAEPSVFIETNVLGTGVMLRCATDYWTGLAGADRDAFRFLHVSTDEVFGTLQLDDPPFDELSPYDPKSPYAASKAGSDHLARAWRNTYGLPVVVTNCSNNYGPYQFPEKLIPVTILSALQGRTIPVYARGENIRDWLHVSDHCRALMRVVTQGEPGLTYCVGAENEIRNIDLVLALCAILDECSPRECGRRYSELVEFVEDRPGHDFRYAINAGRISDSLGWAPEYSFPEGLRQTVVWYLENREWWAAILDGSYRNRDAESAVSNREAE